MPASTKSLRSKVNGSDRRARAANRAMSRLSAKSGPLTPEEKQSLRRLRRYVHKMFNARFRFERRVCKSNGVPPQPPLMRNTFRRIATYRRINRVNGPEAAAEFLLADCQA